MHINYLQALRSLHRDPPGPRTFAHTYHLKTNFDLHKINFLFCTLYRRLNKSPAQGPLRAPSSFCLNTHTLEAQQLEWHPTPHTAGLVNSLHYTCALYTLKTARSTNKQAQLHTQSRACAAEPDWRERREQDLACPV